MRRRVLLADGDAGLISIRSLRLRIDGYEVLEVRDGTAAREALDTFRPDVLLFDPSIDGGEALLPWLREQRTYDGVKVVVNSATALDGEHAYCRDLGADAFIAKPLEHERLLRTLNKVLRDEMHITFWGTRGSLARPGIDTLKFGGNTPCVSVELSKDRYFVFDAGTGIAEFGRALAQADRRYRFQLFLSHARWEHVQGLPFFQPLRRQGNDMVIHGPAPQGQGLRAALESHAGHVCRPVVVDDFASRPHFHELEEGEHRVDGLRVSALATNHPGRALGYRLQSETGQIVAYVAENEIAPGDRRARERMAAFVAGADVLIHNAGYFDHEYRLHRGRGSSPLSEVVQLATDAEVKHLYLFNHDPEHDDEALSGMEAMARGYLEDRGITLPCSMAKEGVTVKLEANEPSRSLQLVDRPRPALLEEAR